MDADPSVVKCLCQRPLVSVLCRKCGYRLSKCRKKIECPEHPNVSYVQDLTECPQCHSSNNYLHEYGTSKIVSIQLSTKHETKTRTY